MTSIVLLLRFFEFFLHNLFTKANVLPNVIKNKLCARPQYASALLRHTLRPSTPYACGSLFPVAVGAMNIYNVDVDVDVELMYGRRP